MPLLVMSRRASRHAKPARTAHARARRYGKMEDVAALPARHMATAPADIAAMICCASRYMSVALPCLMPYTPKIFYNGYCRAPCGKCARGRYAAGGNTARAMPASAQPPRVTTRQFDDKAVGDVVYTPCCGTDERAGGHTRERRRQRHAEVRAMLLVLCYCCCCVATRVARVTMRSTAYVATRAAQRARRRYGSARMATIRAEAYALARRHDGRRARASIQGVRRRNGSSAAAHGGKALAAAAASKKTER